MRKVIAILLCAASVWLSACTPDISTQEAQGSSADTSSVAATDSPEPAVTPRCTVPIQGSMNLEYELYRDCKRAEDVFSIKEIDLPQKIGEQPILPVAFLDEDSVLVYLYKANTNSAHLDENLESIGRYHIGSGTYEKWISVNRDFGCTIQAISESYLVYREALIQDALHFSEEQTPKSARLCVYDRSSGETHTVFEYPEEYIGSSVSYQNQVALVQNQLYFDTVHTVDAESATTVYCADLSTFDVVPYMENAQYPMFDGNEVWVIVPDGDSHILLGTKSSTKIPLPREIAEIAMGDAVFLKLNKGVLANDEFSTWELTDVQTGQPIMVTEQIIDDVRVDDGYLTWASYADAPVFFFDTKADCFLRFDTLPESSHYLRFYQGNGFLQLWADGEPKYYRLEKK